MGIPLPKSRRYPLWIPSYQSEMNYTGADFDCQNGKSKFYDGITQNWRVIFCKNDKVLSSELASYYIGDPKTFEG